MHGLRGSGPGYYAPDEAEALAGIKLLGDGYGAEPVLWFTDELSGALRSGKADFLQPGSTKEGQYRSGAVS